MISLSKGAIQSKNRKKLFFSTFRSNCFTCLGFHLSAISYNYMNVHQLSQLIQHMDDTEFCPCCGYVLWFGSHQRVVSCTRCDFKGPIESKYEQSHTSEFFFEIPDWKKQMGKEQVRGQALALIAETCPKCRHGQMYYWTMQIRSADEGATVFYKCPKCEYTFNQNN